MVDKLYQCADCGLHYTEAHLAEACFLHCTTHRACNLAITRQSVERQTANPVNRPRDSA